MKMSLTEVKKLSAVQLKKVLPLDITVDGTTVMVLSNSGKSMVGTLTKCPNCKMEFKVMPSDGKAYFFTIHHP